MIEIIQTMYPRDNGLPCELCVNGKAQLSKSKLCNRCLFGGVNNFRFISREAIEAMGLEFQDGKVVKILKLEEEEYRI